MAKYFIFITVALGLLLGSISGSSVSVAFPQITESFNTTLILAGWVLSIYQLASTAIMPLVGKAGDILGGKRLFLATIFLFTLGSLFCAIAPNIELLILARLIQAIGGGGLFPLAAGIVAEQFPESRQQAIGFFSSILPIGSLIGPNLGGWMIQTFGWESIFWFNVPFGIIILIISFFTLKTQKTEGGKMDLVGAGLFSGVLSALMVALGQLGSKDLSTPQGVDPVGGELVNPVARPQGVEKQIKRTDPGLWQLLCLLSQLSSRYFFGGMKKGPAVRLLTCRF